MYRVLAFVFSLVTLSKQDITGSTPSSGACLCVSAGPLNVRDSACGNVIGSASTGQCFRYADGNQYCSLSGTTYHFFAFSFNGGVGWGAGTYLDYGTDAQCGGSGEVSDYYTCSVQYQGMRIHETTSATPYDCVDNSCGNSCQGGQCVAYVTCMCTAQGTNNHPPGTNCWTPGTKLVVNGQCNSAVPVNTAVATFSGPSGTYTNHAGVFIGCSDAYTIMLWDQWCCRSIGTSYYPSSHSYYNNYYVITSSCGDRGAWPCRVENSGSTCCQVSVPGCLAEKTWYPSVQ